MGPVTGSAAPGSSGHRKDLRDRTLVPMLAPGIPLPMMTRLRERLEMVERDIARAGISDERVLEAMRSVPREEFYPPGFEDAAYRGGELPGWAAEALTEPLALATLLEGLSVGPRDRVLEVGTGTGYGAAVLGRMAAEVVSVEISGALCELARSR